MSPSDGGAVAIDNIVDPCCMCKEPTETNILKSMSGCGDDIPSSLVTEPSESSTATKGATTAEAVSFPLIIKPGNGGLVPETAKSLKQII